MQLKQSVHSNWSLGQDTCEVKYLGLLLATWQWMFPVFQNSRV